MKSFIYSLSQAGPNNTCTIYTMNWMMSALDGQLFLCALQ